MRTLSDDTAATARFVAEVQFSRMQLRIGLQIEVIRSNSRSTVGGGRMAGGWVLEGGWLGRWAIGWPRGR